MSTLLEYLLVFILAATPFVELLVVIPIGVGIGLDPFLVTLVAFAGNALPVWGIVLLYEAWTRRRGPPRRKWSPRAMRVWERFGLPGIAGLAPLLTGIHVAALMALALRARRGLVILWMTVSLAVWAAATGYASAVGARWLTEWLGAGPNG